MPVPDSVQNVGNGYWGMPTSSIQWCEDNYSHSFYIAEWWNSWSNLPGMIIGLLAIIIGIRKGFKPVDTILGYMFVVIVFTGSFMFHATLSYVGQLLDELPMIYGSLYFHYIACTPATRKRSLVVLIPLGVVITTVMIAFRDHPEPLQVSYGVLVVALVARSVFINRGYTGLRRLSMLESSTPMFALAFILWNLDQIFCSVLKPYHFHAWWHVLTAVSTYMWIEFLSARDAVAAGKDFEDMGLFTAAGLPFGDIVPFIVTVEPTKTS